MSEEFILDASAVLALLGEEKGYDLVQEALPNSVISTVNLSEVITKIAAQGVVKEVAMQILSLLGIKVIAFGQSDAWTSGFLYSEIKHLGLSLGDRACLALGFQLERIVLTADTAWQSLKLPVKIRLIR
jgi:PIN domain nuclease of toxin-antitoxin system